MTPKVLPPFEAYDGEEPYVFVSYSHKDSEVVFKEIKRLHDFGYRIWYDDGIAPASEWSKAIEKRLAGCSLFLAYITERSRGSEDVKDEIDYAIRQNKKSLYVFLEDEVLPEGLGMRMRRMQGIMKFQLDDDTYLKKLLKGIPDDLKHPKNMPAPPLEGEPPEGGIAIGPVVRKYGSLEIDNYIDGILWIDDKRIAEVSTGTIVPVPKLPAGEHTIMISSKNAEVKRRVTVEHNKTAQISVHARSRIDVGIRWILVDGLAKPFHISSTQVTFDQYDMFCDAAAYRKPEAKFGRGQQPVIFVNVADALAFCSWLSNEIGSPVRLPEEDEWEFAARGGNKSRNYLYSGSDNIDDVAWYGAWYGDKGPQVVAQKKPNELGIYDMSGNVWEWCGTSGVLRGGSFFDAERNCRVVVRIKDSDPAKRSDNVGFRCVRE